MPWCPAELVRICISEQNGQRVSPREGWALTGGGTGQALRGEAAWDLVAKYNTAHA